MNRKNSEKRRVTRVFERREKSIDSWRYSFFNPAYFFQRKQFYQELTRTLSALKLIDISNLKILDVGCGVGELLNFFVLIGAKPENCFGVDVIDSRIKLAKSKNKSIHYHCLDAQNLPFRDQRFDLVVQATAFTSIKSLGIKKRIAREMLRVLNSNGTIIWYDFFINNPKNPNTWAIGKKEIGRLFPSWQISFKRVTLAPPITRILIKIFPIVPELLEKIRLLNFHYLATIRKDK